MTSPTRVPYSTGHVSETLPRGSRLLSFHAVLSVFVVLLVFVLMRRGIADPDLWWHLKNADYVWSHHAFPFHDTYSFTARGELWMPHEWMGEMLLYMGQELGGLQGVFAVSFVLCALIFLGVFYLSYRASGDIKNSLVATVLGVALGHISFGPRTLLLGWLCLVILLVALEPLRRGQASRLWIIPPLFMFWVNAHGSWFMGMAILSVIIACGLFEHSWAHIDAIPYSRPHLNKLLLTVGLSVVAVFINPVGFGIVSYPLDLRLKQQIAINSVDEWRSINFHEGTGILFIAVILLLLIVALFPKKRWRLDELALAALAIYMAATYVRMLFLAGILIPPILASRIKLFSEYEPEMDKPRVNLVVLLACAIGIVLWYPRTSALNGDVNKAFPLQAVDYIKSHPAEGNLLNEYAWGGYLIWKDIPVFIDGRADIYDHKGVFRDYMSAVNLEEPLEILQKYRIQRVLLPPKTALGYVLSHNSEWTVEYRDSKAVLFRRAEHVSQ